MREGYEIIIGLEIHCQLLTESKMFCPEAALYGEQPNTVLSPVSYGHPGALPSINYNAYLYAIRACLATHCKVAESTYFARKNYFYPDLPKGYQITQDKTPIGLGGYINIRLKDNSSKRIGITRIHIEEDAGKSLHDQDLYDTLLDLNRAGVGLIEIVSEPDMRSPEEAATYVSEIRKLVRYISICDGNMEDGSLRVDVNVSVRPKGEQKFGKRVEIKNMNSISNLTKAIDYEAERQIKEIESGNIILQQTRTWDVAKGVTMIMRDKETADDYRYFPEPDLLPVFMGKQDIIAVEKTLPPLPEVLYPKYTQELGLSDFDAQVITEQRDVALYFEDLLTHNIEPKIAANWILGPVKNYLNEQAIDINQITIKPNILASLINLVSEGKVSLTIAKEYIFPLLPNATQTPFEIAKENNWLLSVNEDAIKVAIAQVLAEFPQKVVEFKAGKVGLLGFFVGKVMELTLKQADPKVINQLVRQALDS